MSEWQEVKLKDVCEKITVGHVGSMADQYQPQGIPFLRSLNINPYKINFNDLKYIDEAFNSKLKKSILKPNDVVIVRTGYPGTACVIPKSLGVANCSDLVIVSPGKELNSYFLSAIFNSTFGQNLVSGNLVGAAQQHFNITVAKELKLRLPPKKLQDKIAAILSAYDDLIEKNNRRIAILEKMAEEIYREWFVRLRFPGHEQVKFNKGIPEGWEVKKIQDVCKVARGSSPRPINDNKYFLNGTIPWIKIADATASKIFLYETKEYVNDLGASFSRKLPQGSLIIATSGTLGFCIFLGIEGCVHDGWMYLSEYKKNVKSSFLYYVINYYGEHLNSLSYGAAIQNINTEIIRRLPLILPTDEVLFNFYSIIEPIHKKIYTLGKLNNLLKQTRDRLLSRLISGKLSVEDLDIQFPPSMTEELE